MFSTNWLIQILVSVKCYKLLQHILPYNIPHDSAPKIGAKYSRLNLTPPKLKYGRIRSESVSEIVVVCIAALFCSVSSYPCDFEVKNCELQAY